MVEKKSSSGAHYRTALNTLTDAKLLPTIAPHGQGTAGDLKAISLPTVPGLPDRVIAATTYHMNIPLVTVDTNQRPD